MLFGGVYFWTAVPLAIATGAFLLSMTGRKAAGSRIRPKEADGHRWRQKLDLALCALLAAPAIQLIPLPASLVAFLSPQRISYLQATSLREDVPPWLPLTLDPGATLHAWAAMFCVAATHWGARRVVASGGVRLVIQVLAWTAIALVITAVAQSAAGTDLVYGIWRPYDSGARPLGPFINRNHFGTWSLVIMFLCLGCLLWRRAASPPARGWRWRARLAHALDGRTIVLLLGIGLLTIGMTIGASRSTLVGLLCGAATLIATGRGAGGRSAWIWPIGLMAGAFIGGLAYADLDRLAERFDETRRVGLAGRTAIWRDTIDVLVQFPLTGAGAGSFSHVMRVYQTSDRTYYWNEAHNLYLQAASEGGLLLLVPAATGLVALVAISAAAIRRTRGPLRWMRAGAAAALVAAAVQSLWDTGLTLPANGMIAGIAAALLVQPIGRRNVLDIPDLQHDSPESSMNAPGAATRVPGDDAAHKG